MLVYLFFSTVFWEGAYVLSHIYSSTNILFYFSPRNMNNAADVFHVLLFVQVYTSLTAWNMQIGGTGACLQNIWALLYNKPCEATCMHLVWRNRCSGEFHHSFPQWKTLLVKINFFCFSCRASLGHVVPSLVAREIFTSFDQPWRVIFA